jgi:hypothetical protein
MKESNTIFGHSDSCHYGNSSFETFFIKERSFQITYIPIPDPIIVCIDKRIKQTIKNIVFIIVILSILNDDISRSVTSGCIYLLEVLIPQRFIVLSVKRPKHFLKPGVMK